MIEGLWGQIPRGLSEVCQVHNPITLKALAYISHNPLSFFCLESQWMLLVSSLWRKTSEFIVRDLSQTHLHFFFIIMYIKHGILDQNIAYLCSYPGWLLRPVMVHYIWNNRRKIEWIGWKNLKYVYLYKIFNFRLQFKIHGLGCGQVVGGLFLEYRYHRKWRLSTLV